MKIKPDPVMIAKNGNRYFLFPGLVIFVHYIGVGSLAISWQWEGKYERVALSYQDFREVILN